MGGREERGRSRGRLLVSGERWARGDEQKSKRLNNFSFPSIPAALLPRRCGDIWTGLRWVPRETSERDGPAPSS